jgi:prepilin-type N-terminal cleavage/methylation domain-containing protein
MGAAMRAEKGFTLIELLVTLSIVGFVIAAVYSFYLSGLQGWQRSIDQVEYQQSARIALDKIVRELSGAREVSLHDNNKEIRFRVPGDSRILRFRLVGPQLVFDSYPTTQFYYHTVVALNITELQFELTGERLVKVRIGAGFIDSGGSDTSRTVVFMNSAVCPRNLPPLNNESTVQKADKEDAN